jgi:hypothetical protein
MRQPAITVALGDSDDGSVTRRLDQVAPQMLGYTSNLVPPDHLFKPVPGLVTEESYDSTTTVVAPLSEVI